MTIYKILLRASFLILLTIMTVRAQTPVANGADLNGAITSQSSSISINADVTTVANTTTGTAGTVTYSAAFPGVISFATTIAGNGYTLSGGNSATPLFIASPSYESATGGLPGAPGYAVTISNLTISGGLSHGGMGFSGGAGLGGGLFVGTGSVVTLQGVTITGNQAVEGTGGLGAAGGGIGGAATYGGGGGSAGGGLFANIAFTSSFIDGGGANGGPGSDTGAAGVNGGFGGGGGAGVNEVAGNGGFGGGGGYGDTNGNGGFGGGGGYEVSNPGGNGGFGGGAGYVNSAPGTAGFGGAPGLIDYGGNNGAAFGGGVFVQNGSTLLVTGNDTISNNTVSKGVLGYVGGTVGYYGAAEGSDLFVMTGATVVLAPGTGNVVTIGASADDAAGVVSDVADDSVYSIAGTGTSTVGAGSGAMLTIGNETTPGGTVILHGNNTYAGGTLITNGTTLEVFQDSNLGATDSGNSAIGAITLNTNGELLTKSAGGFTTSRLITIGNSSSDTGTLAAITGTSGTYGGIISGPGKLAIGDGTNNGTVILTATETYAGGTTINSGTLQIGNGGTTGRIVGDVLNNGTLLFNHSDAVTFGGIISGSGSVVQNGNSLMLTGLNTYSGGTTLENGTLILANDQSLGTGTLTTIDPTVIYMNGLNIANPILLNGLTSLEVDNNDSAIQSGTISGTSGLIKTGTGTLTLASANTFTGGTTLSAGNLVIANANALGDGSVTVNGGTLMTDGVNHLINVNGNYAQNGGTLSLTVTSPTVYDQLKVSGQATLGGALQIELPNGIAPGKGQTYVLVQTGSGVVGQFSTVTPNLPSIGAALSYGNNVTLGPELVLTQKSFGDLYGNYLTPNEHASASYIDAHDQVITSSGFGNLVSALNLISPNSLALANSFDQLNTVKFHSFASSVAINNAPILTEQLDDYLATHRSESGQFVSSRGGIDTSGLTINDPTVDPGLQDVQARLRNLNANASNTANDNAKDLTEPPPLEANRWSAFASGNVILGQEYSDAMTGLSHVDTTSETAQVGLDYQFTPHFLAGLLFDYGHAGADLDNIGSTARVDTYSPGLYAAYAYAGWYANSLFTYGFSDYTQHRNVEIGPFGGTASSHPSGSQLVLNSDGGYDFHQGNWTFGPTAGLEYVHAQIDGYSESGLPGADLTVSQDQSDSLRSLLGGHLSYNFTESGVVFTPHLHASWQHEYLDGGRNISSEFSDIGSGAFNVRTSNPSRDSALVDLGLAAQINKSIGLFTNYTVQAGQDNYFGQSVQAGVKIGF